MPQTNNIISPKERLFIANRIMCAKATQGFVPSPSAALDDADELIAKAGCIVEGQPQLMHEMD